MSLVRVEFAEALFSEKTGTRHGRQAHRSRLSTTSTRIEEASCVSRPCSHLRQELRIAQCTPGTLTHPANGSRGWCSQHAAHPMRGSAAC
jgi:hypothetical protein